MSSNVLKQANLTSNDMFTQQSYRSTKKVSNLLAVSTNLMTQIRRTGLTSRREPASWGGIVCLLSCRGCQCSLSQRTSFNPISSIFRVHRGKCFKGQDICNVTRTSIRDFRKRLIDLLELRDWVLRQVRRDLPLKRG